MHDSWHLQYSICSNISIPQTNRDSILSSVLWNRWSEVMNGNRPIHSPFPATNKGYLHRNLQECQTILTCNRLFTWLCSWYSTNFWKSPSHIHYVTEHGFICLQDLSCCCWYRINLSHIICGHQLSTIATSDGLFDDDDVARQTQWINKHIPQTCIQEDWNFALVLSICGWCVVIFFS